ncbi:hypothetical protein FRB90_002451 [Tulasnella sp. 427]|nr:hypothetical protein FRB90_002451 [Tulasnella sp. 427]
MISQLKSIQDQIKTLSSSSTFKKLVAADGRADTLKGHQETIRTALEETQLLVSLNAADLLQELYDAEIRKEQRRLLNCLGDANYGAKGDAVEDVICLPGTRAGTLGRIDEWIRDTETSERVLWIRGTAGRGKSTIASTVAYRWRYRAACAIFHFRRGQSSLDKRFVCALARQLGSTAFLEIKNSVQKSIKENEDIAQERLQEQFKTLLVGSLERLEDNHLSILLVIDALDECESTESAVNFIKLVDRYLPSLPVNVKFLLTSRPEAPLMRVLEPRPWHAEDLDMMKDVDEDIEKFIEFGLSKVKTEHNLGEDWPPPDTVSTLVRMSQGLFQWVDTAIRYMTEGLPHHRLQELLQSPSVCDGLDPLYLQILGKASKKAAKSRTQGDLFHRTLGAIVVSPYPISLDVMGFIFAEHEMLKGKSQKTVIELLRWEILLDLTSLIHIPRDSTSPVQLVHTSVRDLLIDKIRCGDVPCWINLDQNHQNLTSEYLRLMNRDLKTNICKLSDLSKANSDPEVLDLVKLYVPSGLQHCCRTWSIHLTACPQKSDQVLDGLEKFSKNQLLRWIEVMSLLGKTGESQAAAKQVKEYLSSSNPLLLELWSDTYRFIIAFHEPISFGALHIYASALPFCPTETALRRHYHDNATARLVNSSQDLTWPMELWSRHVETVGYSLAIGVGGSMIAYSTIDNTIRLCSLESGTPVDRPLIHDGGHPMIFSPDGKAIVSVSPDDMIHFRDAETGEPLRAPLDGHGEIIRSIAFSPNGKILAAGSRYQTIRLWDAESGLILGEPLTGHSDAVSSVAFSRDSAILASGSDDGTVRFWDLKTGAPTGRPLEGHESAVNSVSFSPTSAALATASDDKTIRLWDLETKRQLGEPLRRHSDNVYVAVFSPSGEVLASASRDMTICLWNVERGSLIGEPLAGHSGAVFFVAFSPNGQSLASLSSDQTIRLWDVGAKESLVKDKSEIDTPNRLLQNSPTEEHPLGHANVVNSVDFAPDGRILASGSNDETIRLWEVESGKPIGSPLTLHTDWVNCVAFSPDGEVLASASYDKTVRIWCARTGEPQREPLQHESPVMFVTFSADGTILAAGLADGEIWLWNTRTWESMGEPLYTGTSRPGPCGIFLSDASGEIVLVVGWKETTEIQFWDLKTRRKRGEFSSSSTTMKFSLLPDGRLIRTDEEGLSSLVRCSDFPASLATSLPTTTEGTSKPCLTSSSPLLLGYEGQWRGHRQSMGITQPVDRDVVSLPPNPLEKLRL